MAITKAKKKEIVEKAENIFKKGASFVFVNFKGLKSNDANAFRKQLRDNGVGYYVAKKTLVARALESAGVSGEKPALEGEVALAYGEDALAPAREVYAFEKKLKEGGVKILGGIFDGVFAPREKMVALATIPPVPVLRGQFVNLINSPIQRLVIALDQIAEKKQ